jgi:hypothetical protein
MRHPARLLSLLVLAALALPAAASASPTISVIAKFRPFLPWLHSRSSVPVRLPERADFDFPARKLYAKATIVRHGYHLQLAAAPNCDGDACFVAAFDATKATHLGDTANAGLAHGIRGHYEQMHCGASCAPPTISWVQGGVRYDIQARIQQPHPRNAFLAMANSAIRAGAR